MKIILVRHAKPNDPGALELAKMPVAGQGYKLYTSPAPIAVDTADALWEAEPYEITEQLSEIGESDAGINESKEEARVRAREFINHVERAGCDAVAISHEHFMRVLFRELKKRGYIIKRTNLIKIDYLEKAVATKRSDHCGRCSQNCHLSNPGCDIGREKAKRGK